MRLSPTIVKHGIFHYKLLTMFKLDIQGTCESCLKKATDGDTIRCESCEFYFHGVCNSPDGKVDGIAKQTHLGLHKQKSTKKNFLWKCDKCLTVSEHTQAASVKEMMTQLMDRFTKFENQLPAQIQAVVNEELQKRHENYNTDIDELGTIIAAKIAEPVKATVTPWNDKSRVEDMKASLLVKPDKDGNPVDEKVVNQIVLDNGVPVNKVVVTDTGDTFINLPNKKSRDKLCPLLKSDKNEVVSLKSKLPTITILDVKDDLTKEQIKLGLCTQNETIGKLVQDNEELEVIYTRPPPTGKPYYKVSVRVSPLIRKCIANQGDRVFLCRKSCRIDDNYYVRRCNNCQAFGHYADKCNTDTPPVCGYCGENHLSNTCPLKDGHSRTHICCNCRIAGFQDVEGHSTFAKKCPAYKIQQDKLKNSIAYLN